MDNNLLKQIDNIDHKCDIVLEQLRLELIDPTRVLQKVRVAIWYMIKIA